ncbi:MAG: hypothetical protein V3T64_11650, partial [Myxococcota bacterium]
MTSDFDVSRLVIFLPAMGALVVLGLDLVARPRPVSESPHRADALAGIRVGSVAGLVLFGVWIALRADDA